MTELDSDVCLLCPAPDSTDSGRGKHRDKQTKQEQSQFTISHTLVHITQYRRTSISFHSHKPSGLRHQWQIGIPHYVIFICVWVKVSQCHTVACITVLTLFSCLPPHRKHCSHCSAPAFSLDNKATQTTRQHSVPETGFNWCSIHPRLAGQGRWVITKKRQQFTN